jgi:hypothetical protein
MKALMIANTMAKTSAQSQPSTLNPGTIHEVNMTQKAMMTKLNKPNVRIVIGKVRISKRGLMKALMIPRTTATISAVPKPAIWTPGRIFAATNTATLLKSKDIRTCITLPRYKVFSALVNTLLGSLFILKPNFSQIRIIPIFSDKMVAVIVFTFSARAI